MDNIIHIFNACLITRLLITFKQLTVIEYSILNTLNIYKDYDCYIFIYMKMTMEYQNSFLKDYLSEDDK